MTTFTYEDHVAMARLVLRRFGNDLPAAAAAWRRLLQNAASDREFAALVAPPRYYWEAPSGAAGYYDAGNIDEARDMFVFEHPEADPRQVRVYGPDDAGYPKG